MLTCGNCRSEFPKPARGRPPKRCEACRSGAQPANVIPVRHGEATAGRNEATVRARLGAVGRLDTISGAAALDAAIALDTSGVVGSARAALLKEMRTAAAEAEKGAAQPGGILGGLRDELAQRRGRRAG